MEITKSGEVSYRQSIQHKEFLFCLYIFIIIEVIQAIFNLNNFLVLLQLKKVKFIMIFKFIPLEVLIVYKKCIIKMLSNISNPLAV